MVDIDSKFRTESKLRGVHGTKGKGGPNITVGQRHTNLVNRRGGKRSHIPRSHIPGVRSTNFGT